MTPLKLPTIAREVRLSFRKDSDFNQTLNQLRNQPHVKQCNSLDDQVACPQDANLQPWPHLTTPEMFSGQQARRLGACTKDGKVGMGAAA